MASLSGLQKEWALASQQLDFSRPDAADTNVLNRAIWYGTRGFNVPYPGDARVLSPAEATTAALEAERAPAAAGASR